MEYTEVKHPADAGQSAWAVAAWIALATLCLAQFIDALDVTIVNVALPSIQTSLGFSEDGLQWVVNAYAIAFGGFLLLGGTVGDRIGRKRVLMAGVVAFTGGSIISGLAPSEGPLIVGRLVQGLAAAFMSPMTLSMLADQFSEGRSRNKALSIWIASTGTATAFGVTLGGLLTNGPGWRWIFFINVPVGAFILIVGSRVLRGDRGATAGRRFDVLGAVLMTATVSLFAYTVVQTGEHGWVSSRTVALFAVSALLAMGFAYTELRHAADPLIRFSVLQNRSVAGANVVLALSGAGLVILFYFLSLYAQQVLGYTAWETGLAYLPLSVALILSSAIAPVIVPRLGVRWVAAGGLVIACVGLLLLAYSTPDDASVWLTLIGPAFVASFGFGLCFVPLTIAAVHKVVNAELGFASGLANVSRTLGGALGLAVVGTAATARINSAMEVAGVDPLAMVSALRRGFDLAFLLAAVVAALGAAAAIALFRGEGRGTAVDMTALVAASIADSNEQTGAEHQVASDRASP